jgi:hypothetical protein
MENPKNHITQDSHTLLQFPETISKTIKDVESITQLKEKIM